MFVRISLSLLGRNLAVDIRSRKTSINPFRNATGHAVAYIELGMCGGGKAVAHVEMYSIILSLVAANLM
jgi:hypothetical protein